MRQRMQSSKKLSNGIVAFSSSSNPAYQLTQALIDEPLKIGLKRTNKSCIKILKAPINLFCREANNWNQEEFTLQVVSNIVYETLSYADQEIYQREITIELPIRQACEIANGYTIYFDNVNCTIELPGNITDGTNQ